eukprot:180_1
MSKLWLNMLYLLLENGANPLLPQEQLIYVTHDINKLKKYVWCFDKGIVDNLDKETNFKILSNLQGRDCIIMNMSNLQQELRHKNDRMVIDIMNKYPLSNIYSTPYLRPSVFSFCITNPNNDIIKNENNDFVEDCIFLLGEAMNIYVERMYSELRVKNFMDLMIYSTRSKIIQFVDKHKIKHKWVGVSYASLYASPITPIMYDLDEMMDTKNELNKFNVLKERNIKIKPIYKTLLFTIKEVHKYLKQNTKKHLYENNETEFVLGKDIVEYILNEYVFEDLWYLDDNKIIDQKEFICCWFDGIIECNVEWFTFFSDNVLNVLNKEQTQCLRKHIVSNPKYLNKGIKELPKRLGYLLKLWNQL